MKNKYFLSILCSFYSLFCLAQAGEWTWMGGKIDTLGSTPANYGIQGIADSDNQPPGNYSAVHWTDLEGNFWIFGGLGTFPVYSSAIGMYSDLWKYDVTTNLWTWIKGPGIPDQPARYGVNGIPSPLNNPGVHAFGTCAWTDDSGDLWMYGGYGTDSLGTLGGLTEMWRYNIATNQWTWMKGNGAANLAGEFGTRTIETNTNLPFDRSETTAAWKDLDGNLWLFGGSNVFYGSALNDLWKYNVTTNNFTWMKGDNGTLAPSHYGIVEIPDDANTPGARWVHTRSVDLEGNLWLFGGDGVNDVWKYNTTINQWTWMGGDTIAKDTGKFNQLCDTMQVHYPPPKSESRACWTDKCGNFINFGGMGYNDLWFFDIKILKWIWIGGTDTLGSAGNYGVRNVMDSNNLPPERGGSCSFTDKRGNLWLFGGMANDGYYYNDLWKYTITDTACLPNNCFFPKSPVEEPVSELFIPNTFSPNNDNQNDLFLITVKGYSNYKLNIYNRWGQQVFESNDQGIHWNGKINNNDAPEGTYYYILQIKNNQQQENCKGFITLVR